VNFFNANVKWFWEIQRFRRVSDFELVTALDRQPPAPLPSNWRRMPDGDLYVPNSRLITGTNEVMDSAQQELIKRWRYLTGSDRSIRTMALGSGYTDPTRSDTDVTTALDSKDIESWDDSLISPDSTNQSITKAKCLWLSDEANGVIAEIGLKFDNGDLVTHSLFKKLTITDITQASEGVVTTSAAHGLATGDEVHIDNVVGMTEINDSNHTITVVDADEFSLDGEDTSGYTAYTSGGNAWQIVVKSTGEVVETRYGLTVTS
jgi:hypothetical protein